MDLKDFLAGCSWILRGLGSLKKAFWLKFTDQNINRNLVVFPLILAEML